MLFSLTQIYNKENQINGERALNEKTTTRSLVASPTGVTELAKDHNVEIKNAVKR